MSKIPPGLTPAAAACLAGAGHMLATNPETMEGR